MKLTRQEVAIELTIAAASFELLTTLLKIVRASMLRVKEHAVGAGEEAIASVAASSYLLMDIGVEAMARAVMSTDLVSGIALLPPKERKAVFDAARTSLSITLDDVPDEIAGAYDDEPEEPKGLN